MFEGFVIAIDATHLDISRHVYVQYVPCDVYATELRSLSLSLSLSLSSSFSSSYYANSLRRAWSRTFGRRMHYSRTMSWLRTILYELPRGHFGDGVNPRIVIGKFPTIPWDISSGTDGHDFSPRNPSWLLIVNTDFSRVVCSSVRQNSWILCIRWKLLSISKFEIAGNQEGYRNLLIYTIIIIDVISFISALYWKILNIKNINYSYIACSTYIDKNTTKYILLYINIISNN